MTKILKRPLSVLLAALMVISLFAVVPISASAAEETSTVTWNSFSGTGGMSSGGVTLTTQQAKTRVGENFYKGRGSATFTAPEGSVFTKIELKNCTVVDSLNFPGATVAQTGGYWQQEPWDDEPNWVQYYTVTWTGESSEVTFSGAIYGIQSIVFTLKSVAPPTYTVTWKNGETTLKTDTVDKDAVPAYNGDTPAKTADDSKHYTFSGWSDGTTTYGLNDTLPAVSADVTYTAQFTDSAHSFNSNPVFNWTQTNAPKGDWDCNKLTLSCECGATQDTDVYGISFGGDAKTSAVKCTANANGSYTYSVSKKVGSTTYQDSKTVDANGVVYTANQLKAAAKLGGEWELGNDIAEVTGVSCADGFVLDGNNKTLSAHTFVKTSPMFKSANKTAEYTLKNLTIDGVAGETQLQPAISSATTSAGQTNVINLEGVTITNYDFDAANNGAVLAFGHAKVNLTNCNIDTDSQNDVWGGAASTINVSGGEVGTAYLNGGTSSANLTNGAKVDTIKTATGSTVKADSADMINPPAGYIVQDNGDGTYSIVVDPDPLALAPIIGFQKKVTGNLSGNDIGTQGVRIITKVDECDLTQFDEYGYVVAKVHGKEQATANFNNLKAYGGNGEKTIKCNGSVNTIDGYGTSYVTLAVNGMNEGDQVAARFYAIKGGVTYYSNYVSTARYNGIIATY